MCESRVVIDRGNGHELLMEDVIRVEITGDDIKLMGILGEVRHAKGRIKEIDLLKHTILIV